MPTKRLTKDTRAVFSEPADEIIINGPLLARIVRQRMWSWVLWGIVAFALLLTWFLWTTPVSYVSTTSIAIQQPAAPSSLASILAPSPQSARYLGILKSRSAAADVESQVHLQQFYHLPTPGDAVDMLTGSIKPDDNPQDGLLYLNVALPAPPRLRPNAAGRGKQVSVLAAETANAYAVALSHYYATNDTDRETVLLRAADDEQRQARAAYDTALAQALSFARGRDFDPRTASISSNDPLNAAPADLNSLYTALFENEEQIRQGQVESDVHLRQRSQQLSRISDLPSEDPLLTDARKNVTRDQVNLKTISEVYGPENPRRIQAEAQLKVDQAELDRQVQGIRDNLTTDQVNNAAQLQGLYAKHQTILAQIAQSERRLGRSRRLSGEYGRLQQEVAFRAEILRTVNDEAVKVRLGNVSAKNRMQVVDEAIPAKKPSSSLLMPVAISLFLVGIGILIALIKEYLAQSQFLATRPPVNVYRNGVAHANGAEKDDKETVLPR